MREDERERTADEVSKLYLTMSKLGRRTALGSVWRKPMSWPIGIRYEGGVSVHRALVWNVRTCRCDEKGKRQVGGPHEAERTEARHRGRATRSSDDSS